MFIVTYIVVSDIHRLATYILTIYVQSFVFLKKSQTNSKVFVLTQLEYVFNEEFIRSCKNKSSVSKHHLA